MSEQNIVTSYSAVTSSLPPEIQRAGIIAYLIYDCLVVTNDLLRTLESHLHVGPAEIVDGFNLRAVPTEVENIVASHSCLERFGPAALLASGLFYPFSREGSVCSCLDWSDRCYCAAETWRLDVSTQYASRGVLLPLRDARRGYFSDLLVFRHLKDERPFILKVRADQEIVA